MVFWGVLRAMWTWPQGPTAVPQHPALGCCSQALGFLPSLAPVLHTSLAWPCFHIHPPLWHEESHPQHRTWCP